MNLLVSVGLVLLGLLLFFIGILIVVGIFKEVDWDNYPWIVLFLLSWILLAIITVFGFSLILLGLGVI